MEAQLLQFHKTRYECAALASVVCPECNLTLCLRPFDNEEFANDRIREFCPRCAKQITFSGLFSVWVSSERLFIAIASSLIDSYGKVKDPTTRVLQLGDRYVQFRQVVGKNVAYYIWDGVRSTLRLPAESVLLLLVLNCVRFPCSLFGRSLSLSLSPSHIFP